MCMGMGQQVLIPPTDKARMLCDYLRSCFGLLLAVALLEFLGFKFASGIFDILGVVLGYLATRSSEGYNYQQVLCFLMVETLFCVFSIVDLIMFFAGVKVLEPSAEWMFLFYSASLLAGPIVYCLTVYFTYGIYKQMKVVLDEMVTGMQAGAEQGGGGGPLMGNGYDVQPPRREDRAPLWRHPESHPAPSAPSPPAPAAARPSAAVGGDGGGFQAFSGTGRTLGE